MATVIPYVSPEPLTQEYFFVVGFVATFVCVSSIVFNILLAVVLRKGKDDFMQNPFYKVTAHVLICETGLDVFLLIIVSPGLFSRDEYVLWYNAIMDSSWYVSIVNCLMLIFYDTLYYLQLLIAFYRFVIMNANPKLIEWFNGRTIHCFALVIWIFCTAEAVYLVGGQCTKLYRPFYHFVGVYCTDYYENLDIYPTRWYVINTIQRINMGIPILAMVLYMGLYLKVYFYQRRSSVSMIGSIEDGESENVGFFRGIWNFIRPDHEEQSLKTQQSRIVYQGLILLCILICEPLYNIQTATKKRDYNHPFWVAFDYTLIYITCLPNFIMFFIFNSQMRKEIKLLVRSMFCPGKFEGRSIMVLPEFS